MRSRSGSRALAQNKSSNQENEKEKLRLDKLRKKLELKQRSLDEANMKLKNEKKQLEQLKRKLLTEKKKIKNDRQKLELDTVQFKKNKEKENEKSKNQQNNASTPRISQLSSDNNWKDKKRELLLTINEQKFKIKQYEKEIKKLSKSNNSNNDSLFYQRKLKRQKKEVFNLKRRLRLAIMDMERAMTYYRKQIDLWKKNQKQWIVKQQETVINDNYIIKYIWADDITKVRLRKRGKGGGLRIWFNDGDQAVFTDIDVILPDSYKNGKHGKDKSDSNNDEFYDELIKEVKHDDTLDNQQSDEDEEYVSTEEEEEDDNATLERSISQSVDDEKLIDLFINEMNHRMDDIKNISNMVFIQNS